MCHMVRCYMWCAVSDEVLWNVMRCGMMVVLWCKMWNTEWCRMVWRHIRHGVMRNDGRNAVWDVWCGLECVLWDSVMCNLYFNVAMCMAWCEVQSGHDVEWCAEMWSDLMWIMVRCEMCTWCGMLQFQTWCDVECDWNAKRVIWNMAWCGIECPGMWNVA